MNDKTDVWQRTLALMVVKNKLTRGGRTQVEKASQDWQQATAIVARFHG
jgi:hypothetical protein